MGKAGVPFLCGGTFYILLLQGLKKDRRIRMNALDGANAKDKSINDVTCLKGLMRTFYAFNEYYSDSMFTAHKDSYKFCRKNSTDWLQFETQALIDAFDEKVKNQYWDVLAEMDLFIDTYIDDGELGRKLVRAVLEVIKLDNGIEEETRFYMPNGLTVSKTELLNNETIYARPFLLSVWHYIIKNRGSKNTCGAETVKAWLESPGKQAAYKYVGHVGETYALEKKILFDRIFRESAESNLDEKPDINVVVEDETGPDCEKCAEGDGKTVNQILNTPVIINQHAEKIVNIEHVEHLKI